MIIDTHAHYNLEPFFPEWEPYWETAREHGVGLSIIPGTNERTSKQGVEIALADEHLYAAVGIHPHEATRTENDPKLFETWKDLLHRLILRDKVVAVGECGLDFFRLPRGQEEATHEKNAQKRLFGMQIQTAKGAGKPLIIHCRDAYDDLLDTISHFSEEDGQYPKGVLHCVSGDETYLKKALEMGLYIGVAGNVTYKNAESIRALVLMTPKDRILVETDIPYLPPRSMRGETNKPEFITETYAFLADLLKMDRKAFEKLTRDNTRKLFGI